MTSTNLPSLVGETPDIIAAAEARRATLLPELLRVLDTYKGPRKSGGLMISSPIERASIADRLRKANRASWWLDLDGSSDERLFWSGINPCIFGMPSNSWLPPDFYSERKVVARQAKTEKAQAEAAFLGLAKLKGSEKQVAWAQTIRHKRLQDAGGDAERLLAIAGADTAKFWIDSRELDIDYMLTDEYAADAAKLKEQRLAGFRRKYGRKRS
ncbi:hypothetical protein [Azorhizophilus paspali]|uniref:Uncharacterized protein n=1 Tax=Azorhizophilus paspali TaxID=69963 RepID=A0ABV6SG18_AZOPA